MQGYEELMWIDSDVVFDPDDVERLRAHGLPITCGIYPKKGPRQFACEFLSGTPGIRFGKNGGPVEIRFCGFGFTHTRKPLYQTVARQLRLPMCNQRFNSPLVPYFEPMVIDDPGGKWSISEDYAFCERARRCGFKVVADTRIRLWHVGSYGYGWEDAGRDPERYADYTFAIPGAQGGEPVPALQTGPPPSEGFTEDWFSYNVPVWERILAPFKGRPVSALEIGVFEGRSTVWFLDHVLTHPEATLTWVDTFGGGAEHMAMDLNGLEARFRANAARFGAKVCGHVGRSQDVLRGMKGEPFDLVYVDGSHEAADVLADAVLAWPLLKVGGVLGFDDYGWKGMPEAVQRPAMAVDAFLGCMKGKFEEIHRGYQVWVRKTG
ncbi:class I SAM-dependent methyltransferase [Fimbriiglobus ruber]|uniref:Putative membrane protein n=1 Tax=Fimbriiglobus ruber TaxID=1908690 RepID=A0A225DMY8_9BACT|nr:class I SAM-dependent methyltransferase [Fimbriiglobus ruber]OWK38609.1 putative membrane protein [Fimbriiglobus ruber]